MWVGFSNPTFQPFPNFRNIWTSVLSSDTSIQPTSKPKNPCRSDSRIRHFNHSRIFAMCEHRPFCRIRVSDLRQNPAQRRGLLFKPELAARSRQVFGLNAVGFSSSTFPAFDTAVNQRCAVIVFGCHSLCQSSIFVRSECQINI